MKLIYSEARDRNREGSSVILHAFHTTTIIRKFHAKRERTETNESNVHESTL